MNKFSFQDVQKPINKAFVINVTSHKLAVEKEFGITDIVKILYFSLPPSVSCSIHQDRDVVRKVYERESTIYLLTESEDLYFHTWLPVRPDKIYYIQAPTISYPPGIIPQLDSHHAILLSSLNLTSGITIDIAPWHNVENRSPKNRIDFISVRHEHLISYF